MAKLYDKLQKALTSYAERPEGTITESKFSDCVFTIRGKDQGRPGWHCILVPGEKLADIKAHPTGATMNVKDFGSVIEYRNHQGETLPMSGWGKDPPKMIEIWLDEHYGRSSIDENTSLVYEQDDIRLCTMQRAIPEQKLGFSLYYHASKCFHYIEFYDDFQSSLGYRAGIKNFDRIVEVNGVNVTNDKSATQLLQRFNINRHHPVQILVCSPATYAYYKSTGKLLHSNLPTVQRLKPSFVTSDASNICVNDESFCAIRWENTNTISTVSQSAVFKSPEFTRVNDICFAETDGQYQKGRIIFIGSYNDCEKLKTVSSVQAHDAATNSDSDVIHIHMRFQSAVNTVDANGTLEQLPNELFLYLFTYLDIQNLYSAFWGLNARLNTLFQSYENLCLTFDNKTDLLLMKLYAPHITRLIIDTPNSCDLTQFSNLQTLIVCDENSEHLKQIRPDIVPNLSHLSFLLGSKFTSSVELVNNIFSNKFISLRHANLGKTNHLDKYTWSISPSLRFVSIRSNEPLIVSCILASCPNLSHLQLHVFNKIRIDALSSPPPNHPLRRFTLWSDSIELTSTDIDTILANTSNVQHFYLQTVVIKPFIYSVHGIIDRLSRLSRFDCYVKETMTRESRIGDLATVHQLHSSFSRIECIKENEDFRIFATE